MYQKRLRAIVHSIAFENSFRVIFPDGSVVDHGEATPAFTATMKTDRAVRDVLARSSLGFGEAYVRGEIDVDGDLEQLVLLSFAARETVLGGSRIEALRYLLGFMQRRNTLANSPKNIATHYDIGNDFYELWLDEELQYTCAYFDEPTDTLEAAQYRKMDVICRKLDLKPGQLVVEAGGGWGGLALHMARNWGVKVRSFNISKAQVAYAQDRAEAAGVSTDAVQYILDDYRSIGQHVAQCDRFVSVGMFEHVGRENYPEFLDIVAGVLRPKGVAMVHFISRTTPAETPNPWLEKYVFPGYYNPSLGELLAALERSHSPLQLVDAENLRFHYALTLRHWLNRFERNAGLIRERWGEEIVRTFRLYLNGGLADFTNGRGTLLYQTLLTNGPDNEAPLNRVRRLSQRHEPATHRASPERVNAAHA